jgi:uncharacterized protein HemY
MNKIKLLLILNLLLIPLPAFSQSGETGLVKETLKLQEQLSADTQIANYFDKLKAAPLDPQIHFELGKIYLDRSLYELAISSLRRSIMLKPDFGEAYAGLSQVFRKKKEKILELKAMEKGVEVAPQVPTLRFKLGRLYMEPAFYDYGKAKSQYKSLKKMNSPLAADLGKVLGIDSEY